MGSSDLLRPISGQPSSQINKGTTDNLIQKSIVDPANQQFRENTLPAIGASVAGAGFLGSQRVKATQRASDLSNRNITEASSKLRFDDEQARRDLMEKAANRSANFVPTALDVQNQDILRGQGAANIESTRAGTAETEFGTKRGEALLGSELDLASANIDATRAGTAVSEFDVRKGEALLDTDLEQAISDLGLTEATTASMLERANKDIAETGQITAETASDIGLSKAKVKEISAGIVETKARTVRDNNKAVLDQLESKMEFANIEQDQNWEEVRADLQAFADDNAEFASLIEAFMNTLPTS